MTANNQTTIPEEGTAQKRAQGVWRLAADGLIIPVCDGPATLLVPTESVRVMVVTLPLKSAAKRAEALPYAIEDRIADPLDAVHLAIGASLGEDRYRIGAVRHAVIGEWVKAAEAAGLGQALMVPDALALPPPPEGYWVIGTDGDRALVRDGEGGAFALPLAALAAAWRAAGEPRILIEGGGLPAELHEAAEPIGPVDPAATLAMPGLDLRQGAWQRRPATDPFLRRLFWIIAIGIVAHTGIAGADAAMTRVIAERRAADTRALVQQFAPGTPVEGDLAERVTGMLPTATTPGANDRFLPRLTRLAAVLQPMVPAGSVRSIRFEGDRMILTLGGDATLAGRIQAAMTNAGLAGTAVGDAGGAILVTAGGVMRRMIADQMPTLERGLASFDRWWAGLSLRERRMVSALAAVLALVILIFLIVRPLQAARADALSDIRLHETLNARILAAGRLDPAQTAPAGAPDQVVQQAAAQMGAALSTRGDGFTLSLTEADYGVVVTQLGQITRSGLAVVRADLSRGGQPGRVNGTVELAR